LVIAILLLGTNKISNQGKKRGIFNRVASTAATMLVNWLFHAAM
jgi:Sec-independent protein translocase protein TatA